MSRSSALTSRRLRGIDIRDKAATSPGVKVLFMSGYTDDAVLRQGVHATDVTFLQKPFTPDILLQRVRETLDASHVNA